MTSDRTRPIPDWARAACAGHGPDLWFPEQGAPQAEIAQARAICRSCPILGACREWAITEGEKYGIWGDTAPKERLAIRRQRRRNGFR